MIPFPLSRRAGRILLAATGLALGTTVQADSETGPYVAGGFGVGAQHYDSIGLDETSNPDQTTGGGKLELGWRFTPHWGIELGTVRLGTITHDYSTGSFRGHADASWLAGVGRTRLDEHWALYGKLMADTVRSRQESGTSALPQLARLAGRKGNLVLGGLGLEYRWNEQLTLAVEADSYGKAADRSNAGLLSLDLGWHF